MEKAVELESVSKRFGHITAVRELSLQVGRGEFLTILGPSGCGKTTTLRLIAGFESPDSGRVLIGGVDATALPPYRRNVNTVFQHYALFPHLDVFENVAFGLRRRGLSGRALEQRVAAALELVKLEGFERRDPAALSGGEKQRVALARALVLEPEVLLLDEPLAALDPKLRRQMQLELKGLQRRVGICFIYVTHDQDEALLLSDRVAVMNRGRIEQVDTPDRIYNRPRSEFVADFMGVGNLFPRCRIKQANGLLSAEVASGLTFFACSSPGREEGTATVAVRQEKIFIAGPGETPPAGTRNFFRGRLVEKIYTGASSNLVVELGGTRIQVLEQNRGRNALSVGDEVSVWWDEADTLILSGETS